VGQLHGGHVEARLLTRGGARAPRADGGFTLLEVLISMVILSIMILGFQAAFTGRLLRDVNTEDRRTVAMQLAAERLRAAQLDPVYGALEARYAATEATITSYPGYKRTTQVVRTLTATLDYKTLTVTVEHPRMPRPVKRTLVVAAP
jgi:prepilin-type N-terminal cleavage/methylation domain-containing protein